MHRLSPPPQPHAARPPQRSPRPPRAPAAAGSAVGGGLAPPPSPAAAPPPPSADAPCRWSGLRVAYQGVPGAYSEQASLLAYAGCTPAPFDQFEHAFEACEQFLVDRAVLPIENSLGGSIHRNYDLLLRHRLHIVGEVNLLVEHCLLALPGVALADVRRVQSHPQALSQCDGYLTRLGVVKENVDDTAGAAKGIAERGSRDCAAVASARAGELYGLVALDRGIQDDKQNYTRFLALSRDPVPPRGGPFKTSIVFSLAEGAGTLFKALACFALRGIDLTKIESRPMRSAPITVVGGAVGGGADGGAGGECGPRALRFSYLFYVDLAASTADVETQHALRHLQEMAPFMRVLGCYPQAGVKPTA